MISPEIKLSDTLMLRPDLKVIAEIIPDDSRILDLGCGDGELLHFLKERKNVSGTGVELNQNKILNCVSRGVPVIHGDLNDGLGEYQDSCFDYVVLSQTLQAVRRPDLLLGDMTRVGGKVVISFINIGYYKARCQLFLQGKMPKVKSLPYEWYSTPNIHLATIRDFRELCRKFKIEILEEIFMTFNRRLPFNFVPNFFASNCIFVVTGK